MRTFIKNLSLFFIFGFIYYLIECTWTLKIIHWSLFILAGLISILISKANKYILWEMPLWQQCLVGMTIATLTEGTIGTIINIGLGLNMWSYKILPFFWGQSSILFCLSWFILSGLCILVDDYIKWKWFGEKFPYYK